MDLPFEVDTIWCSFTGKAEHQMTFSGLMSARDAQQSSYAFKKKSPYAPSLQTFKVSLKDKKPKHNQPTPPQEIFLNPEPTLILQKGKTSADPVKPKIRSEPSHETKKLQTIFETRSYPQLPQTLPLSKEVVLPMQHSNKKTSSLRGNVNFQYMRKEEPDFKEETVENIHSLTQSQS